MGIRAYALVGFWIISFVFTQYAYAETGMKVSVNAFEGSTTISVSGHTSIKNNDITIASQAPNGYIISVSQVAPDANGDFRTDIQRNAQLWKQNGMYTIDVTQGSSTLYHMTFQVEIVNGYTRATSLTQSTLEEIPITVVTDRISYIEGDIISISGNVADLIAYTPVSITIIDPIGDIAAMVQTVPYLDGSYFTARTAGGTINIEGEYTINVLYGSQSRTASTTFYFGETTIVSCGPNEVIVLGECINAFDEESTISIIIPSGTSAQGCKITNSCFIPYSISVNTGQTVTWTNKDTYAHTVTSGYADKGPDDNFDGKLSMTGATFSWTAKTAGEYPYFCVIHPWMAGIVIVKGTSSSGIIDTVNSPDVLIPSWIKDVAGFWCEDEIDNASFIEAIQYLINNDVIIVPATASSGSGTQEIPNWIKSNACWWSQNLISDDDFALGLQYLIKEGIIKV